MSKGVNVVKNIIVVIIVLAVIAVFSGIVYIVSSLTNGFTTDFKSFILKHDDNYITNDSDIGLFIDDKNDFTVKYVFEGEVTSLEFNAELEVNKDNDFVFIHGIEQDNFSDVDISSLYTINFGDKGFSLVIKTFDVLGMLKDIYPDEEISVAEGTIIDTYKKSYFNLKVSSYNKKIIYNLNLFQLKSVSNITINPGSAVIMGG